MARTPNSSQRPWRIALYVDGVVPGDVLRLDNKRKATCFYLGILEMQRYLRFEEAWVPVGILRANEAKTLQGGFPAAARALLRSLLVGTDGIGTAGVSISLDGTLTLYMFVSVG